MRLKIDIIVSAGGPSLAGQADAVAQLSGPIFRDCDICPEMVELPLGEFVVGSPQDEGGREQTEGPSGAWSSRNALRSGSSSDWRLEQKHYEKMRPGGSWGPSQCTQWP
jgi:hypothetical protein